MAVLKGRVVETQMKYLENKGRGVRFKEDVCRGRGGLYWFN